MIILSHFDNSVDIVLFLNDKTIMTATKFIRKKVDFFRVF